MKYLVYKTTNLVNNKIYIGVHKTMDINDGYMGSGKVFWRAVEKYGPENFKTEHIHQFDSAKEMFNMESILVNEEFIKREDTYNIKLGGRGGWDYINANGLSKSRPFRDDPVATKIAATKSVATRRELAKDPEYASNLGLKISESLKVYWKDKPGTMLGKHHTDETKAKIGAANRKLTGSRNSQFGSMWITNGTDSAKIKNAAPIPEGWRKGRIIRTD